MTTDDMPTDPYRSPAYFGEREEPAFVPNRRPGGLTAICVIAIIIGSLGLLIALFELGAMVAGEAMQKAFAPQTPPGMENEMLELQEEMQAEMNAIAKQYVIPNGVILAGRFLFAICLIVASVKVLKLQPAGRKLLLNVFLAAIIFELVRFGIVLYIQMQTVPVMEKYMERMTEITEANAPPGAPAALDLRDFVKIGVIVGVCLMVLFLLIKVIFYAIGASYLSKQKIKTLFGLGEGMQSPYGPGPPTI